MPAACAPHPCYALPPRKRAERRAAALPDTSVQGRCAPPARQRGPHGCRAGPHGPRVLSDLHQGCPDAVASVLHHNGGQAPGRPRENTRAHAGFTLQDAGPGRAAFPAATHGKKHLTAKSASSAVSPHRPPHSRGHHACFNVTNFLNLSPTRSMGLVAPVGDGADGEHSSIAEVLPHTPGSNVHFAKCDGLTCGPHTHMWTSWHLAPWNGTVREPQ